MTPTSYDYDRECDDIDSREYNQRKRMKPKFSFFHYRYLNPYHVIGDLIFVLAVYNLFLVILFAILGYDTGFSISIISIILIIFQLLFYWYFAPRYRKVNRSKYLDYMYSTETFQ